MHLCSMTQNNDSMDASRRTVMKQAAATAVVGAGATGFAGSGAAASVEPVDRDGKRAATLLSEHAGPVLDRLAADGVLDSTTLSALPTDERIGYTEVAKKQPGTAHLRWADDERPDEIVTVRRTDEGVVSLTVEPETGKAYAFYEPDGEQSQRLYTADGDVSAESCNTTCTCGNPTCDMSYSAECTTCCDGECHTNYFCNC